MPGEYRPFARNPVAGELIYTLLGTDAVGRDLWSRVLYGARISLSIGFIVIIIAGSIGTFLGAAAGFFGGWLDRAITWFIDLMISVPRLVLLLAIVGVHRDPLGLPFTFFGLSSTW